ncbi:DUF262 domain-containing protein [Allofranklinella schreckenbergeri]|uniref:DUF262 domain-containing protein n=1 Tax=Allofranklinella schreckenbergeri TaxID=1076744 RepID=A0A3M6QFF0_9BURK|nr:DUF262 domain-containing protein [Allofranklinella schreckenbergeri]RMX01232.1 DUF262 domain-containing protein [Allofranklinella schreckenbergeri]
MSIMQQSSKAQDRSLGVWFQYIEQGQVKLPRFQRFEAWDRARITSFLHTIINNLPVGVALALEVAGQEKFESRYIASAEPATPGAVTQHLLDGQQRLTAFWRSMHNNYESETFFVYLPQFDQGGSKSSSEPEIRCIPRWINKHGLRMPRWAEDPAQCLKRGLLPVHLLRPGDISTERERWLNEATKPLEPAETDPDALSKYKAYTATRNAVSTEITTLRERVTHFNLPYLSLPAHTSKDVALQVFINMNTNSKPLSLYDIIVAEVESVTEQSLHALQSSLTDKCPMAGRYGNVSDLILSTSALLQDKPPSTHGMVEMDKQQLLVNWPKLERGLERMATFLDGQRVFDKERLPTNAVLAVIAAAYEWIPEHGDFLAKAEKLLRRYLWSAFFTDRYENTAASRAFADFKAIKALLNNPGFTDADLATVPVLNRAEFPLADVDSLMAAGWPKATGIEARAILAVTTYLGALDFADHKAATYDNIQKREYHHVFPDALLSEAGIQSSLALNCALITWKTNRIIGRKDPLEYLKERVQWASEAVVCERLKSHLISYDLLAKAHYADLQGQALKQKLAADFHAFLRDRASLVFAAMTELTQGDCPSLEALWAAHAVNADG